jgi:hypothetical protein
MVNNCGTVGLLRKLFQLSDETHQIYGSAAAPAPPLHVEHGPSEPLATRRRGTR